MRTTALLLFAGLAGGCYGEYSYRTPSFQATAEVTTAPPEPIVETPPPLPYPGAVWVAGHWDWQGSRYVWLGGRYETPPRAGVVFAPPRWERHGHVWQKTPGSWVDTYRYDRYGRRVWIDSFGRPHYY